MSFIVLKVTSPTLPGTSTNRENSVTDWLGEIFCMIFLCFIIIAILFFDPQEYVIPFLFDSVLRVGFPAYYIYIFPSLYDYVFTSLKNVYSSFLKGKKSKRLTRSPQIDVTV